jgi:hypothetical protein
MTTVKYFSVRKRRNRDFERRKAVMLKKLFVMMLCTLFLTLAFCNVGMAAPEETQIVYDDTYGGLRIVVVAPVEAYPGENITVTVETSAVDVQQIDVDYFDLKFCGVVNATTTVTFEQIEHLSNVLVSYDETEYTITLPDDLSPGLTFGEINCEWKALGALFEIPSAGFPLTYIKNMELEQLQVDYDELNATYQSLVKENAELKAGSGDIDSTRNLMYIFIITTVIASITVVVLLLRKPKKVWV